MALIYSPFTWSLTPPTDRRQVPVLLSRFPDVACKLDKSGLRLFRKMSKGYYNNMQSSYPPAHKSNRLHLPTHRQSLGVIPWKESAGGRLFLSPANLYLKFIGNMCPAEAINYAIGPFDVLRRLLLPLLCPFFA